MNFKFKIMTQVDLNFSQLAYFDASCKPLEDVLKR